HPVIKDEIASIENALNKYVEGTIKPPTHIKQNILDSIYAEEAKKNGLPFILSPDSKINDWFEYLKCNQIEKPEGNDALYMTEFSKTNNIVTYIAWAKPGAFVEEEHGDELERLFMLQGSCKIDFDGVTHYYKEGDFVEIKKNTLHRAEVTGSETMILIGQRLVA
ncbi:MAG: cupin domain-containing protein, partial [Fimbriimonadaceae bacterium]|nr:cupin domain-containing protein [Chitinophagales bacterium]